MEKMIEFDAVDFLRNEEDIQYFLEAAANDDDPRMFLHALRVAAKARGMMELSRQANMPRESLYKALSEKGNPSYLTLRKIARALGLNLTMVRPPSSTEATA